MANYVSYTSSGDGKKPATSGTNSTSGYGQPSSSYGNPPSASTTAGGSYGESRLGYNSSSSAYDHPPSNNAYGQPSSNAYGAPSSTTSTPASSYNPYNNIPSATTSSGYNQYDSKSPATTTSAKAPPPSGYNPYDSYDAAAPSATTTTTRSTTSASASAPSSSGYNPYDAYGATAPSAASTTTSMSVPTPDFSQALDLPPLMSQNRSAITSQKPHQTSVYSSSAAEPGMPVATPVGMRHPVRDSAAYQGGPTHGIVSEGNPVRCHKIDYEIKGHEYVLNYVALHHTAYERIHFIDAGYLSNHFSPFLLLFKCSISYDSI